MIKKILIVIATLIAAVLIYAAFQPDTFHVERSASIKAPPEEIFPLINDFHNWLVWSPYEKLDPALKRSYSGADSGKGAVYGWEGNKEVGKGRMEITESLPPSKVDIAIMFIMPFEAHNTVEFTLVPAGDATEVTWSINGPMPYLSKVMCLFFDMDKMIGTDYEKGLASMKAIAEK